MAVASPHSPLDAERIKLDFPILATRRTDKPLVYLDSANSSQKPRAVIEAVVEVYESGYANVHRGVYHLGVVATEAYEGARDKVAAFLNAPSRREVIFTRQATEALNLVAYAYGRKLIGAGRHIVTTELEHHSNLVPWRFLAQHRRLDPLPAPQRPGRARSRLARGAGRQLERSSWWPSPRCPTRLGHR